MKNIEKIYAYKIWVMFTWEFSMLYLQTFCKFEIIYNKMSLKMLY